MASSAAAEQRTRRWWRAVQPSKETDVKPSDGRGHRVDTHERDVSFTPSPHSRVVFLHSGTLLI